MFRLGFGLRSCIVKSMRFQQSAAAAPKRELKDTRSFAMGIFNGQMHLEQCFPFPEVLNTEQEENLRLLIDPTTKFFTEINDPDKNDKAEKIEESVLAAARELGAFGLQVPENLGGVGLTNTQYARMGQIMGANDLSFGVFLGAHQSIGFKGILLYGNEEQKKKYLPNLASGKQLAAYALTEPTNGSDAATIRTRAEPSEDGTHWVLNGGKLWITNGGICEVLTVFAQTPIKNPVTGEVKDKLSAFIVERAFKGVSSGPPEKKMGIKSSNTAEVYFDNVKVPNANILGGIGNGFKVAMMILNNGRFGMAAALSGTMKTCIQKAVEHATQRVQFGGKLHEYQMIQEKIAKMTMRQYVTESMAYMIAGNMDSGAEEYQLEAAISKIYSSEAAWNCCDESIQILGGMGFMRETGLERILRDLRIFRIFEGANDILRLFVSLTGLQLAGKELQSLMRNPMGNLGTIFNEGAKQAKRMVGMSAGNISAIDGHVHPSLLSSANKVCDLVDEFGSTVRTLLMRHGKGMIHEQIASWRLADAAIEIYASIVVLSRATRAINLKIPTAEHEALIAKTYCQMVNENVKRDLYMAKSSNHVELFKRMSVISKEVVANGDLKHISPLGF